MAENAKVTVIEGQSLQLCVPDKAKISQQPSASTPRPINVVFNGVNGQNMPDSFTLSENLLSRHLLLVGGIGSGKTNTFNHIMRSLSSQLKQNDVMIVFDTKGDFYKEFYRPGDVVISNDKTACGSTGVDYWNVVNEIANDEHLEENAAEIASTLFAERLKSGSDPFFPNAAKDIVTVALYHFVKMRGALKCDNALFSEFFRSASQQDLVDLLCMYPQFEAMKSYIPVNAPEQALGVMAEIQQVIRSVFVGNFSKSGTMSIRNLVKNKGGRRIFIEYDIGVGATLSPVYTLLFDLAIKEALSRTKTEGNVFFAVDEFKLLPNLKHIDDAVNFGRSLGIKFMIGIQNTDQIVEAYNENMAKNIFSGFLNQFAFKVNDFSTRKYIKERAGENRKKTVFKTTAVHESIESANVIEDWDVSSLKLGQAIVMLNGAEPFLFRFREYIPQKP